MLRIDFQGPWRRKVSCHPEADPGRHLASDITGVLVLIPMWSKDSPPHPHPSIQQPGTTTWLKRGFRGSQAEWGRRWVQPSRKKLDPRNVFSNNSLPNDLNARGTTFTLINQIHVHRQAIQSGVTPHETPLCVSGRPWWNGCRQAGGDWWHGKVRDTGADSSSKEYTHTVCVQSQQYRRSAWREVHL